MKNRIYFLGFILVIFISGFSQEKNNINFSGNKEGYWEVYYPNTKIVRWKGNFLNGKEKGIFKHYDEKGKLIAEKDFVDNDNCYVKFYKNGEIESEGIYIKRKKNGEWKYYKNNNIVILENYSDDILNGERKMFYQKGGLMEKENYNKGELDGEFEKYTEEGELIEKGGYTKGKKNGNYISYYKKGKISAKGNYKDDIKIGKWLYYDLKGNKKEEDYTIKKERKGKWIDETSEAGKFFYKKFRDDN